MPANKYSTLVQCPFYQTSSFRPRQGIRRISCEGLVEHSNLALNYRYQRDFTRQLETYCCRFYDKCEVYRMLMEKYEEV